MSIVRSAGVRRAVNAATATIGGASLPATALAMTARGQSSGQAHGGGGFFGTLKKKWEDYELQRDRALDRQAQDDAAEQRRQRFQPLTDEEGGRSASSDAPAFDAVDEIKPIWENAQATPRSVLFVPANKVKALHKIYTLNADCYILDLEDSVGPTMKRAARENVRQFVDEVVARVRANECPPLRLIVRINSPDHDPVNAMLDLELVGLLGMSIEGVAIPKISATTYDVVKEYVHPNHQLWAFFETPKAILEAPQICAQSYYRYAVIANNDLAAELRLPGTGPRHPGPGDAAEHGDANTGNATDNSAFALSVVGVLPLWHATLQVLLSARAQGMHVIGGVFNDPTDRAGFARHVACDRALGLDGKTVIHPSQIDATNAAWTPSQEEVQWAYRVKAALSKAQGGVATVDGVMVEQLHVRQASRLIALYNSAQVERRTAEAMEAATVGRAFADIEGDEDADMDARFTGQQEGEDGSGAKARRRRRSAPPSRHQPARPE